MFPSPLANLASDFDPRTYGFRKLSYLLRKTSAFEIDHPQGGALRIRTKPLTRERPAAKHFQVWLRACDGRKDRLWIPQIVVLAMLSRSYRQRLVAIHRTWRAPLFLLLARTLTSSVAKPTSRNRRVNARSGAEDQTASTPFGRNADLAARRPSWL